MPLNVALKAALFATGRSQRTIARRARMSPVRLSMIVRGHVTASEIEQKRLARVLDMPREALFANPTSDPPASVEAVS